MIQRIKTHGETITKLANLLFLDNLFGNSLKFVLKNLKYIQDNMSRFEVWFCPAASKKTEKVEN